jgi:hypothetical protein
MTDLTGGPRPAPRGGPPLRRGVLGGVLVIGLALALAACGGGPSKSGSSPTTNAAASSGGSGPAVPNSLLKQSLEFAQCMRSHGVTNYPDPSSNGGSKSITQTGINTSSPTYQSAFKACQGYAPSGTVTPSQQSHANAAQLLFAQCMRKHGVTNFPDPSANPNGGPQSVTNYGINPNSPTFKAANSACQGLLSGGSGS